VTGAAPLWIELMNFLHHKEGSPKKEPPARLVSKEIQFSYGMESFKKEWFILGTEPPIREKKIGQLNYQILYPPSGTVIAMDPDIPSELQKVFFISQSSDTHFHWILNGIPLHAVGKAVPWAPCTGEHLLAIADQEGRMIDSVRFEVRGIREN
jgi:penicillin-binding protein 1C